MKLNKLLALMICCVLLTSICAPMASADVVPGGGTSNPSGRVRYDECDDHTLYVWFEWLNPNDVGSPLTLTRAADSEKLRIWSHSGEYENSDNDEYITTVVISEDFTAIGDNAFNSFLKLENVILPDTIVKIGEGAFCECSNLYRINLPESLTTICFSAFKRCLSLIQITIPASVISIGGSCFRECGSLRTVRFASGSSLETIHADAFGATALRSVVIPWSVTHICGEAFSDCLSLTSVSFPNDRFGDPQWALVIDDDAFQLDSHSAYPDNDIITLYASLDSVVKTHADMYGYAFQVYGSYTRNNGGISRPVQPGEPQR